MSSRSQQDKTEETPLDTFETRVLEVIGREATGPNRFTYLQEKSGIAAQSWKSLWYRKQHATSAMLSFVFSTWPQYAEWISTGRLYPLSQLKPGALAGTQIRYIETTYNELHTRLVINLIESGYIDVYSYCYGAATKGHRKSGQEVGRAFIQSSVGENATLEILSSSGEWEATTAALHAWLLALLGRCNNKMGISGSTSVEGLTVSDFALICQDFNITVLENPSAPSNPHTIGNLQLVSLPDPCLTLNSFKTLLMKRYEDFGKRPDTLFSYDTQED